MPAEARGTHWPTYSELLTRDDAPPGSSWGLFGPDDELGTLNFLNEAGVLSASHSVQRGRVFNLDHPINAFVPSPARHRRPARHTIVEYRPHHLDDSLDDFFLQGSTQIDALRHVGHHRYGFYNDTKLGELVAGTPRLGIQRWSETGIIGRGVMIDVAGYQQRRGKSIDHERAQQLKPDLIDAVLVDQGVVLNTGDIVLLRTDWLSYYRRLATGRHGDDVPALSCAGIAQSYATLAWIWDHGISLLASDNFALEAYPASPESPFADRDGDAEIDGLIHPHLIAMLGLAIGELWALDELADDCARDGRFEFMIVAKPLNLVGGVGSPGNAVAIK